MQKSQTIRKTMNYELSGNADKFEFIYIYNQKRFFFENPEASEHFDKGRTNCEIQKKIYLEIQKIEKTKSNKKQSKQIALELGFEESKVKKTKDSEHAKIYKTTTQKTKYVQ